MMQVVAVQIYHGGRTAEITFEVPEDSGAGRLFAAMFPEGDAVRLVR